MSFVDSHTHTHTNVVNNFSTSANVINIIANKYNIVFDTPMIPTLCARKFPLVVLNYLAPDRISI